MGRHRFGPSRLQETFVLLILEDMLEYYSTLFHELAHSTGHESRLNRKELVEVHSFGTKDYSREELTAEISSAFLCAESAIENTIDNSAAYIASWRRKLADNPKWMVEASGKAQKAADYILNRGGSK